MSFKVVLVHSNHQTFSALALDFFRARGIEMADDTSLYDCSVPRHHPALIAMVEELGDGGFVSNWPVRAEVREMSRVARYRVEQDWDTNAERVQLEDDADWVDPTII